MTIEFTQHRLFDAYGFILADPFDEFLKSVSVNYLEKSWEKICIHLSNSQYEVDKFRFGFLHPGVSLVKTDSSPLSFFGWITGQTYAHGSQKEDEFDRLSVKLMESSPKVCWGSSHRAYQFEIDPQDFKMGLEACIYYCTSEVSLWNPTFLLENSKPSGLWKQLLEASKNQDESLLQRRFKTAIHEYTSSGYDVLERGFNLWKMKGYVS